MIREGEGPKPELSYEFPFTLYVRRHFSDANAARTRLWVSRRNAPDARLSPEDANQFLSIEAAPTRCQRTDLTPWGFDKGET